MKSSSRSAAPAKRGSSFSGYPALLTELRSRVQSARMNAMVTVNTELLRLYWDVGRLIVERQTHEGWGSGVIPRLASDLQQEFDELSGFSERNIGRMVAFHRAYPDLFSILPPVVAKSDDAQKSASNSREPTAVNRQPPAAQLTGSSPPRTILPPLVAKLPWAHHVVLLEKVKNITDRAWYMEQAVGHSWSRSVLSAQIKVGAHRRSGKAISNFATTLSPLQSDLAQQTLKDPYIFDFLALGGAMRERELEQALTDHIQKFLVALGAGFAFVGRQVHLEVGEQDYYLDLLFYHLQLRCFIVIDLKVEAFKPEFAGKMNFYLSAVDEQLRHATDQPTIGLLLCQENNRLTVEYALRDVKKPIGVAEWKTRLVDSLPKKLQGILPSIETLEKELGRS